MIVVIQIQPAAEGEELTVTQQINEVHGPFADDEQADSFIARAQERLTGDRHWLIIPLSGDFTKEVS